MALEHCGAGQAGLDAGHFQPGPGLTPVMQGDALGGEARVRRRVVAQQLIEIEGLGRRRLRIDLRWCAQQLHERLLRGPGNACPARVRVPRAPRPDIAPVTPNNSSHGPAQRPIRLCRSWASSRGHGHGASA
nr:hypothetical protein [Pseudomonas sp. BIGb0427]